MLCWVKRVSYLASVSLLLMLNESAVADSSLVAEGQELYGEFCQNCHGPDRSGLDVYAGDLAALTARLEGLTDEMPDFTDFFEKEEIDALYAYLTEQK